MKLFRIATVGLFDAAFAGFDCRSSNGELDHDACWVIFEFRRLGNCQSHV